MSEWEPLESRHPIWKAMKKGEVLEGTVVSKGEAYNQANADIQTIKGIKTTPAHMNLGGAIAQTNVGDYVKITYDGLDSSRKGKNPFERYTVLRKRGIASK